MFLVREGSGEEVFAGAVVSDRSWAVAITHHTKDRKVCSENGLGWTPVVFR